ncbi:hypothetical protein Gotur_016881 [Gossypium turneri]
MQNQQGCASEFPKQLILPCPAKQKAGMEEEVMMSMTEKETAAMNNPHFVLVHGLGGGAWCWYKIKCLMEISGYKVSCIDLKGAGTDRSDANSIVSFDDYNKPLMDFMSALPHTEQVILVGHSAGGLSVTQATHKFANKIRLAVYVAATMLKSGFLTDQDTKDGLLLVTLRDGSWFPSANCFHIGLATLHLSVQCALLFSVTVRGSQLAIHDILVYKYLYRWVGSREEEETQHACVFLLFCTISREWFSGEVKDKRSINNTHIPQVCQCHHMRPIPIHTTASFRLLYGNKKTPLPTSENKGVPDFSQFGDVYELGFGLGAEQPPTTAMVKKEFQRKIIYQMSPQEDSTLAALLLRPGPTLALQSARFKEDGEMVEKVGRIYIKTMHDNVIKPEQQEAMIKKWPPSQVHVLDSDHSPFFSAPFSLFGLLLKVAATSAGYK